METWVVAALSSLLTALTVSGAYHLSIVGRLSKVEAQVTNLHDDFREEKARTSERVALIARHIQEVLEVAKEVLKQNTVLVAELRADRRDRSG